MATRRRLRTRAPALRTATRHRPPRPNRALEPLRRRGTDAQRGRCRRQPGRHRRRICVSSSGRVGAGRRAADRRRVTRAGRPPNPAASTSPASARDSSLVGSSGLGASVADRRFQAKAVARRAGGWRIRLPRFGGHGTVTSSATRNRAHSADEATRTAGRRAAVAARLVSGRPAARRDRQSLAYASSAQTSVVVPCSWVKDRGVPSALETRITVPVVKMRMPSGPSWPGAKNHNHGPTDFCVRPAVGKRCEGPRTGDVEADHVRRVGLVGQGHLQGARDLCAAVRKGLCGLVVGVDVHEHREGAAVGDCEVRYRPRRYPGRLVRAGARRQHSNNECNDRRRAQPRHLRLHVRLLPESGTKQRLRSDAGSVAHQEV